MTSDTPDRDLERITKTFRAATARDEPVVSTVTVPLIDFNSVDENGRCPVLVEDLSSVWLGDLIAVRDDEGRRYLVEVVEVDLDARLVYVEVERS